jgi:hypothetical protein
MESRAIADGASDRTILRHLRSALAASVITLALAGCAVAPSTAAPSTAAPTRLPPAGDGAIELVGMWRVTGAEGESAGTWLRLDAGELHLWRDCGPILGSWRAGDQTLAASVWGSAGECASGGTPPEVPWLSEAVAYQQVEAGWELLDVDGEVVATLVVDGAPEPIPSVTEEYARAPVVTDLTRSHFTPSVPLPGSLAPVEFTDALLGAWYPPSGTSTGAHVEFTGDGAWVGSDGCNGASGRWVVAAGGEFLATAGPSTLMGCEGSPVPHWVASAARAGFDGDQLVLLDPAGAEVGRLDRG